MEKDRSAVIFANGAFPIQLTHDDMLVRTSFAMPPVGSFFYANATSWMHIHILFIPYIRPYVDPSFNFTMRLLYILLVFPKWSVSFIAIPMSDMPICRAKLARKARQAT